MAWGGSGMTKLIIIVLATLAFADVAEARRKSGPDSSGQGELMACLLRQQEQGRTHGEAEAYCHQYLEDKRSQETERFKREEREHRESEQQRKVDEMHRILQQQERDRRR